MAFTGRGVLCLFVSWFLGVLFLMFPCFSSGNSAINWVSLPFGFPVVDRPCLVLARQCREKKLKTWDPHKFLFCLNFVFFWELNFFWWQAQVKGDRARTAIWELEFFLVAGPVKRRKGYKCNLGIRDFWVAGSVGK